MIECPVCGESLGVFRMRDPTCNFPFLFCKGCHNQWILAMWMFRRELRAEHRHAAFQQMKEDVGCTGAKFTLDFYTSLKGACFVMVEGDGLFSH